MTTAVLEEGSLDTTPTPHPEDQKNHQYPTVTVEESTAKQNPNPNQGQDPTALIESTVPSHGGGVGDDAIAKAPDTENATEQK